MEPNDKKPWLIPGDEGGGDGRRAATGETGELLKAKKEGVPWSVKSQYWWSKNRSRESLGYCLYCFLKGFALMRTMKTRNHFSGLLLCWDTVLCSFSASAFVLSAQPWHTLPEARSKHSRNHGNKKGSVYPWNWWWEPGWASLTLFRVWLCVLTLAFDTSFLHLPAKVYHLLNLSNLDFLTLAAVEWLSKSLMFYWKQSALTVKVEVMVSLNSSSLSRKLAQNLQSRS